VNCARNVEQCCGSPVSSANRSNPHVGPASEQVAARWGRALSPFSGCLKDEIVSAPGVILEQRGIAHVAAERIDRSVAAHVHHLEDAGPLLGGRRQEARPEAVAGRKLGQMASAFGVLRT